MATISINSPAKINLWLRVTGRRKDGYHLLETRFLALELHDTVTLQTTPEGSGITCSSSDPALPTGRENLAARALASLADAASTPEPDMHIHIEKRTPSGAGLGGGSSNAAAVLAHAARLAPSLGTPSDTLRTTAARLGADVPFFLEGTPHDATGIGDVLTPVDFPHRLPVLLVKPAFGVSTPWAYRAFAGNTPAEGAPVPAQETPWGPLSNSLEAPVFRKYLLLGAIKQWLLDQPGTRASLMSGSGSTVFAILSPGTDAAALAETARSHFGPTTWVCATHTIPS